MLVFYFSSHRNHHPLFSWGVEWTFLSFIFNTWKETSLPNYLVSSVKNVVELLLCCLLYNLYVLIWLMTPIGMQRSFSLRVVKNTIVFMYYFFCSACSMMMYTSINLGALEQWCFFV
uniref:Uncharacterized protein n=1 Tax=Oryza brachyantha TaxID=4533 RepID=J3MW37_ORYBR